MKRLIITCFLLVMVMTMGAQRYMRYHMNDGTFNGFYTDCVDSILHSMDLTQVYANGQVYEIPLANVDSVTFEGVDLATDADNMVGRYRIYEYEVSPTDSVYNIYKKAYFDNRALLITSKTGEFGPNDTIMIHSDFYGGSLLMFTDDGGNICRVFDGEYMLDIITHEDGSSTVHLFGESSDSILATLELPVNLFEKYSYARAVSVSSLQKALKGFVKKYKEIEARSQTFEKAHPIKSYLMEQTVNNLLVNGAEWLGEVLTDIESDPNFRYNQIMIDGVQIVGDLVGIGFMALGGTLTGGALWGALGYEIGMLTNDFHELMEDCLPSSKVREEYQKYYEQKYGIMLYPHHATDITDKNATLNGTVYSTNGITGSIYFYLWNLKDDERKIIAQVNVDGSNYQYSITANIGNLEPNTKYSYYVIYECNIAGMKFVYYSDEWIDFRTDSKAPWTCPDDNHPHAIDLGLPSGTKWACCDVSASSPNENGGRYAWGETEEKSTYYRGDYIYNIGDDCAPPGKEFLYIGSNISGSQYDVAHVKWGAQWRMPTVYDFIELVNNCTTDYFGGKNFRERYT